MLLGKLTYAYNMVNKFNLFGKVNLPNRANFPNIAILTNRVNLANRINSIQKKHINTLVPWVKQSQYSKLKTNITHSDDVYIYSNKKKIVDFTSGLMVVNLGHNNKEINQVFLDHVNKGITYTTPIFSTYQRELLSDRLTDLTKMRNGKVFFTNGGSDANEMATFIALEYSNIIDNNSYSDYYNNFYNRNHFFPDASSKQLIDENNHKSRILSLKLSYHGGSTVAATLLSGDDRKNNRLIHYQSLNNKLEPIIPNPDINDKGQKSLNVIENEFKKGDVSSIILEGSSGSSCLLLYPDNFLAKVRKLCDKYNVVFICDEVMSGWGRTGTLFAYQKHNIIPDIITTAKGLTSGYCQLGAVIICNKISKMYDNYNLMAGLTYFGHPLACSISNKCLDLYAYNDMEIVKNVNHKGKILSELGNEMKKLDSVKDYRNNGLLGAIELNIDDETKLSKISESMLNNGIFSFRRKNLIFTAPPLIIKDNVIKETMSKINDILSIN